MAVFALLGLFFGIALNSRVSRVLGLRNHRDRLGWALGVMFLVAGCLHFARPAPFVAMVPPFLPAPEALVVLSGIAELITGVGLTIRRYRRLAAMCAVILLVAVVPANIYAAQSGIPIPGYTSASWYRWLRVAFQIPLIACAVVVARRQEETRDNL